MSQSLSTATVSQGRREDRTEEPGRRVVSNNADKTEYVPQCRTDTHQQKPTWSPGQIRVELGQ